jgi:predicted SnoaL-like aldol condensation-catalyzing enzyme
VIAEDDLVVLHYHLKMSPDDLGQAVVDIFRVEDERIVEHWDVLQAVPAESANTNGMF